jgi:hypothetical protein
MLGDRQNAVALQTAATLVGDDAGAPVGQPFGQAKRPVILLLGPLGLPSVRREGSGGFSCRGNPGGRTVSDPVVVGVVS